MGRFTSPDWSSSQESVPYADFTNPQSLNLYSYLRNNPLGRVDGNGHVENDLFVNVAALSDPSVAAWIAEQHASPAAKAKSQQIASSINNFNSIVSHRVDSIIAAYKSGHYVLSRQEASLAGMATNPAGSDALQQGQVSAGARSALFSIEAKQFGEQINGQLTSFLASASKDDKLNLLGQLSHGAYSDAPKGVAKGAAAAGSFALGHIPAVGGALDWMSSHMWNPQTSARDDATARINQSLGSN